LTEKIGEIGNILRLQSGKRTYYFGVIGSDKVRALIFVPAIESGQQDFLQEILEQGYQRPGSPARMRSFRNFLEEKPDSVIPPVVLSSRDNWEFRPGGTAEDIGTLELYGPAAVVDGQHRLGGYVAHYEKNHEVRPVSFILLEHLSLDDESQEFRDINNSQKGVPRALTAFLEQSEWAQIAWALNEDPDSPFHRRISRTTVDKDQLFALHSVAKQMQVLFSMGGLSELDQDVKVSFTSQYFTIISDVWQSEWSDIEKLDDPESDGRRGFDYKILELTGLIAWCKVGSTILHRCYNADLGMNWNFVRRFVEIAGNVDWRKGGKYAGRTGLAGARVIAEEMEALLTRDAPITQEEQEEL
jgi:DNA sulfur modification protein DndB